MFAIVALGGLLGGCDGSRERAPADSAVEAGTDAAARAAERCPPSAEHAAPAAFAPLTRVQYANTVRDLLRLDELPDLALPPDPSPETRALGAWVAELAAERYLLAAERLAERAVADLDALLACDRPRHGDDACAERFVAAFGRRAYRRSLSAEERAALLSLHAGVRDQYDFEAGIQAVVQALLSSPRFLYVAQRGPGARASRLSFLLWNGPPDDALLDAAERGELATAEQRAAQAARMLDDPRAARARRDFYREWLELDGFAGLHKDPAVYPDFDPALARDLRASLERFLDEALAADDAIAALFLGRFDYRNERLSRVYGPEGVAGAELVRVAPDPARYAGLLTHPGLLALFGKPNQSDPVQRARFVRERLLCQLLPQPPSELILGAPDPDPELSTRERFAEHAAEPLCAGCHRLLDPLGFGLEHYDGLGRYRDRDQGHPVRAEGELVATFDADGRFDGALELSEQLAGSADVRACLAEHWLRRALPGGAAPDRCRIDALARAWQEQGSDLRALLLALVQSDAFAAAEVAP